MGNDKAAKSSGATRQVSSANGRDGSEVTGTKSERVSWAQCVTDLNAAEERFRPINVCRAKVPCDSAPESYMGQHCGYPLEIADKYNFLLETGEWTE